MRIRWSTKGERQILNRLAKLQSAEVNRVVRETLNEASEVTAELARQKCPVDTGALRSTIRQVPVKLIRNKVATGVEAGGPSGIGGAIRPGKSPKTGKMAPDFVDYERYVHEDLTAHHDVGEAKFMEKAMLIMRPHIKDLVLNAIRALVKGKR
jgi:hypothetical protein